MNDEQNVLTERQVLAMSETTEVGRVIINTVGISAILNLRNASESEQAAANEVKSKLELADNGESAVKSLIHLMKTCYGNANSKIIPAEISSLSAIEVNMQDKLYFLAGKSANAVADQGEICGQALAEYYQSLDIEAGFIPVLGFTVDKNEKKSMAEPESFLRILDWLVKRLQRESAGSPIIINLTGGYKLGGIYAALVGLLNCCQIYYLHEEMRVPVGLPSISPEQLMALGEDKSILSPKEYEKKPQDVKALYQKVGEEYHRLNLVSIVERFETNWRIVDDSHRKRYKDLHGLLKDATELLTQYQQELVVEKDPAEQLKIRRRIEFYRKAITDYEEELMKGFQTE